MPHRTQGSAVRWHVARVPAGFALTLRRVQLIAGSPQPVQHLVYSDGLASVSVFIELNPAAKLPDLQGPDRMGSASTYSTRVNGHQVTVVGEVPPKTVEEMAGFVKTEDAASGTPLSSEAPLPGTSGPATALPDNGTADSSSPASNP
jgi:sigma-E factor negative regulatory protein RseB